MKKNKGNYFLVDFENVNNRGLDGIDKLCKNDTVIIFYSNTVSRLNRSSINRLKVTEAEIIYEKVDPVGKNALDFQLSSYVGYLARDRKINTCYIVSRDKGYGNIQSFWKDKGLNVILIHSISNIIENYVDSLSSCDSKEMREYKTVSVDDLISNIKTLKLGESTIKVISLILRENALDGRISKKALKASVFITIRRKFGINVFKEIKSKIYEVFTWNYKKSIENNV